MLSVIGFVVWALLPALQTRLYGVRQRPGWSGEDILPWTDMNRDGIKDVLVFDRTTGRLLAYEPTGQFLEIFLPIKPKRFGFGWGTQYFGSLGDLDRDGIDDLYWSETFQSNDYRLNIYLSTRSWRFYRGFVVPRGKLGYGVMGTCGDLTGDKISEFVVSWWEPYPSKKTVVEIWNGATFGVYKRFVSQYLSQYGRMHVQWPLTTIGDLNKDGAPDLVEFLLFYDLGKARGYFRILSGKDFRELLRLDPEALRLRDLLPQAVAGDLNGDGYLDFLFAGRRNGSLAWEVLLISGKDGKIAREWFYPGGGFPEFLTLWSPPGSLLDEVQPIGDVDKDGVQDLLVPYISGATRRKVIACLSGKDPKAKPLFQMDGGKWAKGDGIWYVPPNAALGDIDADGYPDFYLYRHNNVSGQPYGIHDLYVFSAGPPRFVASQSTVSYSRLPKTLTLTYKGMPSSKVLFYFVLGSLSGIYPGVATGNQIVPLVPDAYFDLTLQRPGGGLVARGWGPLPRAGRIQLSMNLPAGLPRALIGKKLYHSFVTVDLSAGRVHHASDPVTTLILP